MGEVVDSLMAFILYHVREIVLRGRTVDFRDTADHESHSDVRLALQALLSHPLPTSRKAYATQSRKRI